MLRSKTYAMPGCAGIGSAYGGNVNGQIMITGGYVEAISGEDSYEVERCVVGGAGIGSGAERGVNGGDVNKKIIITGGTVIAIGYEANDPKHGDEAFDGQAIGNGGGDGLSSKDVELYDTARVYAGDDDYTAELQTADKRLTSLKKIYAKIEPCEHRNVTYWGYSEGHKKTCENCSYWDCDFMSPDQFEKLYASIAA